ncbi:hypothetical protein K1T71_013799 [Dendrolimus kikuchii]|uniref:Uncharacterized protein n=1 Tax=Dendrolimus kikuchii TaxID=765133 RepID=A0ACC1CFZ9_9NEOP|nr:hypothetical protein K1T71_013799 [Dendrolimus kikuchii]
MRSLRAVLEGCQLNIWSGRAENTRRTASRISPRVLVSYKIVSKTQIDNTILSPNGT